ncbi:MAG: hypothetical protein F4089_01570 [Gammaproteobacteria bacterium]|nr:hypothetical protein [Gammaproteobacteria bacterium]MYJ73842.1 hypothetical protein [Gammaproteobacteria bacterium]
MEPATTQSIYYLVAGGCALLAAVIMLIVRIESHGRWKGEMEAHKAEMTEHKATVAKFMEEIRDRLLEVFDRLPPVPVAGGSPLRLTKLGETIAEELDASEWIAKVAAEVRGDVEGKRPYDVQEFCGEYIHEVFRPDDEQDEKIKACAYDHGLTDSQVLDVLVVLLRDELLSATGEAE